MVALTSFLEKGQVRAEEFLKEGIQTWVAEGRLTQPEGATLTRSLSLTGVEAALFHLGAHFAISLPLRFPFGAVARFFYTLTLRLRAEVRGLLGKESAAGARRCHTAPVMLFALIPGFGRLAYLFSPALRGEKLLVLIPVDQVSRKLPFRAYQRLHLDSLFAYWAQASTSMSSRLPGWPRVSLAGVRRRFAALGGYLVPALALFAIDAAAFAVGLYLYLESDRSSTWWFDERSIIATLDVVQLLAAAYCGVSAYRTFWRNPEAASVEDRAGIFLWGLGGAGMLVFAADDYLTLHEWLGSGLSSVISLLPLHTGRLDDLIVLAYALMGVTTLYVFRFEVLRDRPSSTLLVLGFWASLIMVTTDAFATTTALKAVELPAQTLASSLLLLAFFARLNEVNAGLRQATATFAPRVAEG